MGSRGSRKLVALAAFILAVTTGAIALRAADHLDSPAAAADPTADITDVYAWMTPDASKVNLVMDVYANAPATAMFSDQVLYVFHVNSKQSFAATTATETDVVCGFDATQKVSCWVGGADYVTGDASVLPGDGGGAAGIASADGKVRVFTGLRDDPFFFNLAGFNATVAAVEAAAPGLTFDAAGCPAVNATTSAALVTQLKTAADGSAAKNFFAGFKVLALVVQVDKTLLTAGGSILGIWGSTNRRS